jgi:hypothetical protein
MLKARFEEEDYQKMVANVSMGSSKSKKGSGGGETSLIPECNKRYKKITRRLFFDGITEKAFIFKYFPS